MIVAEAMRQASALQSAGRLAEAEKVYRDVLATAPEEVGALHMLGVVVAQQGRLDEAHRRLSQTVALAPDLAEAHSDLALVLHLLGRREEALVSLGHALRCRPAFALALANRAAVEFELGRYAEALASSEQALALDDRLHNGWNNRGLSLLSLGRNEEALASFDRAVQIQPTYAEAWHNRATSLYALFRHDEALASCDRALSLAPTSVEAWNTRGVVLHALHRSDEAMANFDRALGQQPAFAKARQNRGVALASLRRHDEAARELAAALALDPSLPFAVGAHLWSCLHCGDWSQFEVQRTSVVEGVRAGRRVIDPLAFLALTDSASDQAACARIWCRARAPAAAVPLWRGERYRHARLRVAYLSSDLREHAVSHLLAGVFEAHDRARLETTALSSGTDDGSPMRARVVGAFEHFIDIGGRSDREVAALIRDREIDIVVDLNGYTEGNRAGVLALRPAPVAVNYLGFPGTLGAPYIDYVLADRFVIPQAQHARFSERVVLLPHTFQANDRSRTISQRAPTRADAGLPEAGFVFCAFGNTYKITPEMFGTWMRLLSRCDGSVMWLLGDRPRVADNLAREARARGIDPRRLVFAGRLSYPEHLARYRLADLFLDTFPFNGGATVSDALWAGLPVVTCAGEAMAARMAGSLLRAAGLAELVTTSSADYEALALALAHAPERLASLRAALVDHRDSCPLFDTERSCRDLEAAYATMSERHQRGEPPASFAVQ